MICIYPADCTDFSTNGAGTLLPQSCTVTETLNGEYELMLVHPIDVYVVERVGNDTDIEIREGKNLLGVSYDVDLTNVTTRIMPTGEDKDGELLYLPELYVDSKHISDYPHPRWMHLSVSEAKEVPKGDDKKTKT